MRSFYLYPICGFILIFGLTGCSSKPESSDVKPIVEKIFSPCADDLKVSDFKKTNGVDNGDGSYSIAVTYKITVLKAQTSWSESCQASPVRAVLPDILQNAGQSRTSVYSLKQGDTVTASVVHTMVKSENGWIDK